MVGIIIISGLAGWLGARLFLRHRLGGGWRRGCGWGGWRRRGRAFGPFGGDLAGEFNDRFPDDLPGGDLRFSRRRVSHVLRFLADRLDATPAQERLMSQAVDQFQTDVKPVVEELSKSRADLAAALRRPSFDEVLFGELFARQDTAIEKGRKAFMDLVGKLHQGLEEVQRERLASIVERGPRFFHRDLTW